MNQIDINNVQCPYCGEMIEVLIDCSVPHQNYIEGCQVCCRPIDFDVTIDQDRIPSVLIPHGDELYGENQGFVAYC